MRYVRPTFPALIPNALVVPSGCCGWRLQNYNLQMDWILFSPRSVYVRRFCQSGHGTDMSHLAKCLSDLKQNGTQEKTPFSGIVFHTLSHGVLRFVASVSFKNHE